MNDHLNETDLFALTFDGVSLSVRAAAHLASCPHCQAQLEQLRQLADDLEVAQRSKPSSAALQRYVALFEHVKQTQASGALWDAVRAVLKWDSRQQPALQGVRGAPVSYRLLYMTPRIELEVMIEMKQQLCHMKGDLINLDLADPITPAFVQLLGPDDMPAHETETDHAGLFRFSSVVPGSYKLLITPKAGAAIVVDNLELA
ncbi:MAG: hypothetical protein H3C34_26050 [Caldilineaceae bacterium]|nr:hypothetical protein [Caldilineaceae bacterium]